MPDMSLNGQSTNCSEGAKIALGSADQVPPGEGRCFKVGDQQIAVFKQRDGAVFALQARCPHQGGPLADGLIGAGAVVCPLHGWRFRLGDGAGIENGMAVKTYAVEVSAGCLWLRGIQQA
jgi:nitrite reductase (NADH) small subunit